MKTFLVLQAPGMLAILAAFILIAVMFVIAKVYRIPLLGMMALVEDYDAASQDGRKISYGVATAKKIYAGALVVLNVGGYAEPGTTALAKKAKGRACAQIDNSAGQDGDLKVEVEQGVFRYLNSAAGDAITIADISRACYIVDDQTVAKTNGGGTRSIAGKVADVDADGVWVDFAGVNDWPMALVALADAAATLTAAQLLASGIFTITPSVGRALTTDTAANLVAAARAKVGDTFQFTIVCLAAQAATLTAGAGVAVTGVAAVNNVSGSFLALFTNVGAGTEAVIIYRM